MIITSKCNQVFNTDDITSIEKVTPMNNKLHWLWHIAAIIVFIPALVITISYNLFQEDYYEVVLTFNDDSCKVYKLDKFDLDMVMS